MAAHEIEYDVLMRSRRPDRVIEDQKAIEEILDRACVGHLGLCWKNKPYVVPLLFAYKDETIFLHSSDSGMINGVLPGMFLG